MKKRYIEKSLLVFILVCFVLIVSVCQTTDRSVADHGFSTELILPMEYIELQNPIEDSQNYLISRGKEIFQYNCVACHGDTALGNGSVGVSLDPSPANLAISMAELKDSYLYWRIAKGGIDEPFNSAMPSWEAVLTDQEMWEVVSFLRTIGE